MVTPIKDFLTEAISSGKNRGRQNLFPSNTKDLRELTEEDFRGRLERNGYTLAREQKNIKDQDSVFEYLRYRNRHNGKCEYVYDPEYIDYYIISKPMKSSNYPDGYRVCVYIGFDSRTKKAVPTSLHTELMIEGDETELVFKEPMWFTDFGIYDRIETANW